MKRRPDTLADGPPLLSSWRQLSILLVEDTPEDAQHLVALLKRSNGPHHRLTHKKTLTEALEHIKKDPEDVDAVLLDLGLPDTEGSEGIDSIARRTRPGYV